jgi:hypothetical protein
MSYSSLLVGLMKEGHLVEDKDGVYVHNLALAFRDARTIWFIPREVLEGSMREFVENFERVIHKADADRPEEQADAGKGAGFARTIFLYMAVALLVGGWYSLGSLKAGVFLALPALGIAGGILIGSRFRNAAGILCGILLGLFVISLDAVFYLNSILFYTDIRFLAFQISLILFVLLIMAALPLLFGVWFRPATFASNLVLAVLEALLTLVLAAISIQLLFMA